MNEGDEITDYPEMLEAQESAQAIEQDLFLLNALTLLID